MRILNVNMTIDSVSGGGTAERTVQISRSLVRSGVECDVLILDLGLTPERLKTLDGVRIAALPCLNKRFYVPRVSIRRVRKIVEEADVVHLMGHWTLVNAIVYFFARRLGKPYVVCPAGALPIYGRSKMLKRFYNHVVGIRIIQNADAHVAIVKGELPQFERYGIGADRVTIIPNGVNPQDFLSPDTVVNLRETYGIGQNPFLLFVGRLNSIKGPDLLLKAFCQARDDLPDHHLVFAGPDGGMLSELKSMAHKSGVGDRIHFIGYLGGALKSRAYHDADLLVIPSRQEAMSIVVLEAGITGTPVLITDRCGFDEIAETDGGKVVPASELGLRNGLIELLGQNASQAKLAEMGANLRKFVENNFVWDSIIGRYLRMYEKILKT